MIVQDRVTSLVLLAALTAVPIMEAFHIPSNRMSNRRSFLSIENQNQHQHQHQPWIVSSKVGQRNLNDALFMTDETETDEETEEEDQEPPDDETNGETDKEDDETDKSSSDSDDSASQTLTAYKSGLNPRRNYNYESRPGASTETIRPLDVTMKFGGSSLANAERVDRVAHLIYDRIHPPAQLQLENGTVVDNSHEVPVRPRAVICSAMGKTTNSLLSAGEMALEGRVDIEALRTLHMAACREFDLPSRTTNEIVQLLQECEDMLNGVRLIQELSPKSLDQLVSYGERCSVRIMAARLNQIGVPAQAFDAWDVGVFTDENYGDAKLKSTAIESIKEKFGSRIDPNVVAVVTGFIGE